MAVKVSVDLNKRVVLWGVGIGVALAWGAIAVTDNGLIEVVASAALFGIGWFGRQMFSKRSS